MLEELERWEEAEIKEINEEDSKKSINITAVNETPDPKVLSEYYDLNKMDFDTLVELFKRELNDTKRLEEIKEEFSEQMRRDEEDRKYV